MLYVLQGITLCYTLLSQKIQWWTRLSGFFLSLSETVGSPVPDELYNFTWTVYGFSGAPFTYPACIICVCLKKAKQRPDRRGNPVENMPTRWRFFSKTQWDLSLGLFERGVFFRPIEKKMKGVFSKSYDAASMQKWHTKICLSELIRIKFLSWKEHETFRALSLPKSEGLVSKDGMIPCRCRSATRTIDIKYVDNAQIFTLKRKRSWRSSL